MDFQVHRIRDSPMVCPGRRFSRSAFFPKRPPIEMIEMIELIEMIEMSGGGLAGIRCARGSGEGVRSGTSWILEVSARVRCMGFAYGLSCSGKPEIHAFRPRPTL